MTRDLDDSAKHSLTSASEIIYEYLYQFATTKSPSVVIQEFKNLLVQGKSENIQVNKTLEKIIFAYGGQQQFDVILSHCCYLILDCWSNTPESLSYASELLKAFELVNHVRSYDRRRKQLIQLISNFQKTVAYCQLQAIITIINSQKSTEIVLSNAIVTNEVINSNGSIINTIVNNYLTRYIYLYQYFLPQNYQFEQLTKFIQKLQKQRQQDFEFQLSKHIIYRFRLKQMARMKLLSKGAGKIITKVDNPTLLSEAAFKVALQQYLGKIDDRHTVLQQSQRFLANNNLHISYQEFKQKLHQFLTFKIHSRHSNYNFKKQLEQKLEQIFPQSDPKPLNKSLILQTCRQLFSFLVTDPTNFSEPQKFRELTTNLGTAQAMLVLVKITLICPESQSDLAKKLSTIVTYYQLHNIQDATWLIKTLEHLLMAFSIYFGKIDVSVAKSVINEH
ncbi:MAG: hypothetical protein ACRC06_02800 [Waterburya sp.]